MPASVTVPSRLDADMAHCGRRSNAKRACALMQLSALSRVRRVTSPLYRDVIIGMKLPPSRSNAISQKRNLPSSS